MAKIIAEGNMAIYMFIDRINSLVVLEDNLEDLPEAIDHCGIYWRRNRITIGNNLLICNKQGIATNWLLYDPELEYAFAV